MAERTWPATSTWTMVFKPDFFDTANFFGKDMEVIDLEMNPHQVDDDVFWALTMSYMRKDAEKFGDLLQKFDKLTGHEMIELITGEADGADYNHLPF